MRHVLYSILLTTSALAGETQEAKVQLGEVRLLQIVIAPSTGGFGVNPLPSGVCPPEVWTLTDSDFGPGEYIVQAGFEQQEAAAAAFTLPTEAFPVHFNSAEILFATANATTQTTTEWSFELWQGTPGSGTLIESYASDGTILPHLVMPPGTSGTILQILIDPGDPEQIYIEDNGSHTYTVAFRIEAHHSPGAPCLVPPDQNACAFPTTDTSGLQFPAGNWIDAVDGNFCVCGAGWFTFQSFPTVCTPSGDWVLRSTCTPASCADAEGACCMADGTCLYTTELTCNALSGAWTSGGVTCDAANCQPAPGACCVESTGACVEVDEPTCLAFGGIYNAEADCATYVCFPDGACCLDDGGCTGPVSQDDCELFGGGFMGHGSDCATTDCPDPVGWCCPDDKSFCSDLTEETCSAFGANWGGAGTSCDDATACDTACPGDVDGTGDVDVDDLLLILSGWGGDGDGDADGDGDVDVDDLLLAIGNFGPC